jgi:hypothetical protein
MNKKSVMRMLTVEEIEAFVTDIEAEKVGSRDLWFSQPQV